MYLLQAFNKKKQYPVKQGMRRCMERGSIMLEVVAVLALMGVMGAMLFRQIYQRNQELHNIQMASEIRTVKEAFAAYIQANKPSILNACDIPASSATVEGCRITVKLNDACTGAGALYCNVADYLPDGWFTGSELQSAYTLTVWNYLDGSGKRVVYGIVVPTSATLPTTGWNFRRAARVALLVGADGGAYNPGITGATINGSLGSWEIDRTDVITNSVCDNILSDSCSVYVATTGIDIFSPEYELPEGDMKLPDDWSLALKNLHAYNYFSVGNANAGAGNCYTLGHNAYAEDDSGDDIEGKVKNDGVTAGLNANCQPLFWVGSETGGADAQNGNVYVATDLNIGSIGTDNKHDGALKLTSEGVIKQKDGLTIDKDGRIIAKETIGNTAIGDLAANEHFVVDPAYTSTMNDIRLTSRGGARLSDILPNYILKKQGHAGVGVSDFTVEAPDCPEGYKRALVVIPTIWDTKHMRVNVNVADIAGKLEADTGTGTITVKSGAIGSVTSTVAGKTGDNGGICVQITDATRTNIVKRSITDQVYYNSSSGKYEWKVRMGKRDGDNCIHGSSISDDGEVQGVYQTYCVWTPSVYKSQASCEAAGYTWSGGACTDTKGTIPDRYTPATCTAAGGTWDSSNNRCQIVYPSSASGASSKAVCDVIGGVWDGASCSCPSGTTYSQTQGCHE